mmetsp:Transcript_95265/g.274390  ORF Transcript_95265/g.274390 Transcript_95265/m.274390 type:complete len:278 (-) Transcript_95265:780-1613(-)
MSFANWAMHSSRPLRTASAIEASSCRANSSSDSTSLSSPIVTTPRRAPGAKLGGRGTAPSPLTSPLTSSRLTPRRGGPLGGRGPSSAPSPGGGVTAGARGAEGAPNSALTGRNRMLRGGASGADSADNSALTLIKSASGANLYLNVLSKSSWPLKIRTQFFTSTSPASPVSDTTNSWYWSTLPHSVSRDFTAARNVAAETSSCIVGPSPTQSSSSSAAPATIPEAAPAAPAGGAAGWTRPRVAAALAAAFAAAFLKASLEAVPLAGLAAVASSRGCA